MGKSNDNKRMAEQYAEEYEKRMNALKKRFSQALRIVISFTVLVAAVCFMELTSSAGITWFFWGVLVAWCIVTPIFTYHCIDARRAIKKERAEIDAMLSENSDDDGGKRQ
jgi:Na+/melibiose symporter-like transporter